MQTRGFCEHGLDPDKCDGYGQLRGPLVLSDGRWCPPSPVHVSMAPSVVLDPATRYFLFDENIGTDSLLEFADHHQLTGALLEMDSQHAFEPGDSDVLAYVAVQRPDAGPHRPRHPLHWLAQELGTGCCEGCEASVSQAQRRSVYLRSMGQAALDRLHRSKGADVAWPIPRRTSAWDRNPYPGTD